MGYYFITEDCVSCATCVDECPNQAISEGDKGLYVISAEDCLECGCCAEVCPNEAIKYKD